MPSTPTTKSQVQAYRFVLRRMQSALVRRDAVMLHDPMRTHSRATMVGVVIAALGMLGFIVFGLISDTGGSLKGESIVVSEDSGAVYVATGDPIELIPTFNVASARLLLAGQQEKGAGGMANDGPVEPTLVSDDELAGIPTAPLSGIPSAPPLLPDTESEQISQHWAVCDRTSINQNREDPDTGQVTTTVIGGIGDLGRTLGNDQAVLASAANDDSVYLIYRAPKDRRSGTADVVRAEVNMGRSSVVETFNLDTSMVRAISVGMLNAIPQVKALNPPEMPNRGQEARHMSDIRVGNVFRTSETGGASNYYLMLEDGKQAVSQAVAQLTITEWDQGDVRIPEKAPANAAQVPNTESPLELSSFPRTVPEILTAQAAPTACLGWRIDGEGPSRNAVTSLHVGDALPKDEKGENLDPVEIHQASSDGVKVDNFYMPAGKGAVVRGVTSNDSFGRGPIYLISGNGTKYSVPDVRTAKALGLRPRKSAPDSIIRLLPDGASLSIEQAQRSYSDRDTATGTNGRSQNGG